MECPHITYSEYGQRLLERIGNRRVPLSGSIEVTPRCNLQCVHCYINEPAGDQTIRSKELTTQEWFDVIDQIVAEGCLWLLLTGGEPFVRPDFLDIYTHAIKSGLLVTLFTNGTTITPQIADYLAEWPPNSVEITVYGHTKETYEKITDIPGSFERFRRGVDLLMERKIPLKLKSVVLTVNQHELDDIKQFAEDLDVEFRFDPIINPRRDGDHDPLQYRLTPQEVVALDMADEKRRDAMSEFMASELNRPYDVKYLYDCGAGRTTFHIDPYGDASICMAVPSDGYNVREGSFGDFWNTHVSEVRAQKYTTDTPCRTCELYSMCDRCAGIALGEVGDPEQVVPYLCEIAHLRDRKFAIKILQKESDA